MTRQRNTRSTKSLKRRAGTRPGDLVLVVCEGRKTEPSYFKGFRSRYRLSANIEVIGEECGNAPISVVDFAVERKRKRAKEARRRRSVKYDEVWCVFDHDGHESLQRAMQKAADNDIRVALSVPCFEIWFLLHFSYTTKCFQNCDEVCRELVKHIGNYQKGDAPLDQLLPLLSDAIERAEKLRKHNVDTESSCPATDVDLLVKKLNLLRRY